MDALARSLSRLLRALLTFLALTAVVPLAGCDKLAARAEAKRGNSLYENESYREALAAFQRALELDPSADVLWRSVGLSAMALHRAGVKSADNDRYADVAVDAFERHLRSKPDDERIRDFLMTVLVNAERHDQALARLRARVEERPDDRTAAAAIDGILLRTGRLDEALASAKRHRPHPDKATLLAVGVAAWRKAFEDPELDVDARKRVVDTGLEACGLVLAADAASADAMTYTNLLYREKANLEVDPDRAAEWNRLAEEWYSKALAARARSAAGPRS